MPVVDFIFLSLTIFSSLLGLSRGFVKEFLSLTKWLLSLYIAVISFEKTKIILSGFYFSSRGRINAKNNNKLPGSCAWDSAWRGTDEHWGATWTRYG